MSWRDTYQQPRFRGAVFQIEGHDATVGGRRVALHEFPARDIPYAEDLGRITHEFSFAAYVVGSNYMQERDALIAACQKAGAGELIHPYLGRMTVICKGCSLRESSENGGMARFSLQFVESGGNLFPIVLADVQARVYAASVIAQDAVRDDFLDTYETHGLPAFVAQEGAFDFATLKSNIRETFGEFDQNYLQGYRGLLDVQSPLDMITDVKALIWSLAAGLDPRPTLSRLGLIDERSQAQHSRGALSQATISNGLSWTPSRQQQALNAAALRDAGRRLMLISAAETDAKFQTVDDASEFSRLLTEAIDAELETEMSSAVFEALSNLYRATAEGIASRSPSLPRTQEVFAKEGDSALTLSWRISGGLNLADEIVDLNRIPHPGLLPRGSLLHLVEAV